MKTKSTSLFLPIALMIVGPCLSVFTWGIFFGGSNRDSQLTWAIMDIGFFGGMAMFISGIIWLIIRATRIGRGQ